MLNQHNRIRACHTCPNCLAPKDEGLVICWPCNRKLKAKHDGCWGERTERGLDSLEAFLTAEAKHAPAR
jgi:hypothetical protein